MRVAWVLFLLTPFAAAGPWKLAPSELLRYERNTVTIDAKGADKLSGKTPFTIHGHDLRGEGEYLPPAPARKDLPALFAFNLKTDAQSRKLKLRGVVRLQLKGIVDFTESGGQRVITATWRFASRGSEDKGDTERIRGGEATATTRFDAAKGEVVHARVRIVYTWEKLKPKKKDAPKTVDRTFDYKLVQRRAARWKGHQADVDGAIDRGVAFLRTLQLKEKDKKKEKDTFEPHGNYFIGSTSLAILTLASCDVPRSDPAIKAGLAWLFRQEPVRNYDRAVALMAIDRAYTSPEEIAAAHRRQAVEAKRELPDPRREWCMRVAAALEKSAASPGAWDYKAASGGRRLIRTPDSSNTQYAVLGLRAAARIGYSVREQTWLGVIRYFGQVKEKKGKRGKVDLVYEGEVQPVQRRVKEVAGFRYSVNRPHAWGAMDCAGIASLAIARDELRRMKSARLTASLEKEIESLILGGWAWLDRHWAMDRNPLHPHGKWHTYYLYSLERAGILTGVKKVGGKDWYLEGVAQLLARQKKGGGWGADKGKMVDTCLALLFLKRATKPTITGYR